MGSPRPTATGLQRELLVNNTLYVSSEMTWGAAVSVTPPP